MRNTTWRGSRTIGLALVLATGLGLAAGDERPVVPPPPPSGGLVDTGAADLGRQYVPAGISPAQPTATPRARSRYRTLLKKLPAPADQATYGDFFDYGFWSGAAYAGQSDLPPGYWVYLAPDWYIFKEDASAAASPAPTPRLWGPEQATGAPDTWPKSGDIGTAWASKSPDAQPEWLELTYATPVAPTAVLIYETFNPGAVNRLTTLAPDGKETELWSGSDPTPAGAEKGISVIAVHPPAVLNRIRIYLDSPKVPGWNEIDAVGLLDDTGKTQWAASATASSTYAIPAAPATPGGAAAEQNPVIFEPLLRLR